MAQDESGQPARMSARLVEEGYVSLQERMKAYRQARNQGNRAAGLDPDANPVILLQDAVETFFHLIRPYIEREPRLAEYWRGALADYPDGQFGSSEQALAYFKEHSVGVWQAQTHTQMASLDQHAQTNGAAASAVTDGSGLPNPAAMHERWGLSGNRRILVVDRAFDGEEFSGWYFTEGRFSVLGLRDLKDWEVRTRTVRQQGNGFMAGETAEREVREPEPAKKVETAAEMLVDVADELDAIATYEPSGERVHGTPVPDE